MSQRGDTANQTMSLFRVTSYLCKKQSSCVYDPNVLIVLKQFVRNSELLLVCEPPKLLVKAFFMYNLYH